MNQGLSSAVGAIQSYGRGPDTMLAHISPHEANFIDQIQGGRRVNPATGLPEYGLFGKILKGLARAAGTAVGFAVGGPAGAALGAGLTTKLTGGSWKQAMAAGALAGAGGFAGNAISGANQGVSGFSNLATNGASIGPLAGGAGAGAATSGITGTIPGISSTLPAGLTSATPMTLGNLASAGLTAAGTAGGIGAGLGASLGASAGAAPKSSGAPPDYFTAAQQNKGPGLDDVKMRLGLPLGYNNDGSPIYNRGSAVPAIPSMSTIPQFAGGGAVGAINNPMAQQALRGYMMARKGGAIAGDGDGKEDKIPAMLSDGEHVIDASTVSDFGNGSNSAGHKKIEEIKRMVRAGAGRKNPSKPTPKQRGLSSIMRAA